MHTLRYHLRTNELKPGPDTSRSFFRPLPLHSQYPSELEQQPVDRSKFFTTPEELVDAVKNIDISLVARDQPADVRGAIRSSSSVLRPSDILTDADIQAIAADGEKSGTRIGDIINGIRTRRALQAQSEDWWARFADARYFSHNVFQTDPTEQIIIGRDQIEPVTVYNFGETLRRRHIEGIIGAVAAMSALTDGYTRAIVPYIVVHEAFLDQHFKQSNTTDKAAGRAWHGEPFIEARRSALNSRIKGSSGQSWVSQLVAHEISHQVDEEVSANLPDFSRYFHYVDKNGDGLIDYVKPTTTFASTYDERDVHDSRPVRDYGYTNSAEDFATVGEELPFGGFVEKLRRDAYLEIIEAFKDKGAQKYGEMQPLPDDLRIEIVRGGEIRLPVAPALVEPIKIRVDNTNDDLLTNFFKRILG